LRKIQVQQHNKAAEVTDILSASLCIVGITSLRIAHVSYIFPYLNPSPQKEKCCSTSQQESLQRRRGATVNLTMGCKLCLPTQLGVVRGQPKFSVFKENLVTATIQHNHKKGLFCCLFYNAANI
jgi:hypothetical protein